MERFILLIVIGFVYWIFQLVSQNKAKGRVDAGPRRPAGPPRDRRIQSEIDDFLNEIGGGRKIEKARDDDIFIEIAPEKERTGTRQPRRPGRSIQRKRSPQPQPVTEPPPADPPVHQRPGSGISERKSPGSTGLGRGVRKHVSEHMREGMVAEHVQEHLAHDVNKSVRQHLGTSFQDQKTQQQVDQSPTTAHAIVKLLYEPSGMRQAIFLSEILSRPKGLRKSS
jgi:hypothetical protein